MIGEVVGKYRIVRELGRGGMGQVFVAEHVLIGKPAVVKVLLPEYSQSAEVLARFFNEAKAAARIQHPGLIDVFDYGKHDATGSAYIVMELLNGENLAARLERDVRLALPLLASVTRQIASAVGAAHQKGIVHRDLKPDNVFLLPDEAVPLGIRVKVLDFGIAKLAETTSGQHPRHLKTRSNAIIGTPVYMSPEQCRGAGGVDTRSDIYSLGCMVFEMASGRPPFLGEGSGDLIAAHMVDEPPRLRSFAPDVPEALDALVARMLAKRVGERVQTMAEVAAAIAAFAPDATTSGSFPAAPGVAEAAGAAAIRTPASLSPAPSSTLNPSSTPIPSSNPSSTPAPPSNLSSTPAPMGGVTTVTPVPTSRPDSPTIASIASRRPTTLGEVASESIASRPSTRSKAPLIAAVVLVMAAGAGGVAWRLRSSVASAPSLPAPPPAEVKPAFVPLPAIAVPSAPHKVTLRVESDPSGAQIYRLPDMVHVGETPHVAEREATAGDVEFELRLQGYEPARISLAADRSATRPVKLVARKKARPAAAPTVPTRPAAPEVEKKPKYEAF